MRGTNLFEEAHIVNALPPVDGTGGKVSDRFKMSNHRAANIIFQVGVSAAAFTKLLVNASSDAAGTGSEAIPFRLYKEETSNGDTLSAYENVLAAGYTPSANNDIMYGIYIDAAELPDGKPWVDVQITNGANSVIVAGVVVLTGAGYFGSADGQSAIV